MPGDRQERAHAAARPRGHSLVLAAAALTALTVAGILALSAGFGQAVDREEAPAGPVSREEEGVETDPPGATPAPDQPGLRPERLARSFLVAGLPLVAVGVAAVARRRGPAIAARGAATLVLALWTPLFAATGGALFLLAAVLMGVATGLAVSDRPGPSGAARRW